jgi:hypothetical protein
MCCAQRCSAQVNRSLGRTHTHRTRTRTNEPRRAHGVPHSPVACPSLRPVSTSAPGLGAAPPTFAPRPGSIRPQISAPGLGAAALGEWRHAFSPLSEVDVAAALSPSGHLARLKAAASRLAERCPSHQPPCTRALALQCGRGEPSPGADVGGDEPSPGADVGSGVPGLGADVAGGWAQSQCRCGTAMARARASSEVDADSRLWARSWRSWDRGWSASSAAAAGTRGPIRVKLTAPRLD